MKNTNILPSTVDHTMANNDSALSVNTTTPLNRYVKVDGHTNWFLVLQANINEPIGLSENMQERILRSQVCRLHNDTPATRMELTHRLIIAATRNIDYERLAIKYGNILIRPIGSFMPLYNNKITEEVFDKDFPIDDYAEIVICENDETAEYEWTEYLKKRFPHMKILTINYFDLRSDYEVEKYFSKAKYVTFSTTFSNYDWFKKLSRHIGNKNVIGFCHIRENWDEALIINPNVEIVKEIY
jgi:hypothetical protein